MLTHTGTQTIETERLILRRFEYTDCDAAFKNWASDEKVQMMYSEPTYRTKEEVNGLLDKYICNYEREDYYRWAIIGKEAGECIGQIAYFLVDSKNHFAEIEYCIGEEFQCRGSYAADELIWHRPSPDEEYYDDILTILGHTPTRYYGADGEIFRTRTWIDIDAGASYGNPPILLRLDDLQSFRAPF